MEITEDIVIVGGGIAGLTTSLGLHRLGIRSMVLESADSLRITGFAFMVWSNAWKALEALGIADSIRRQHKQLQGVVATSLETGAASELSFEPSATQKGHEVRCVKRKILMETLVKELPSGTIRFSSKVVSIESGHIKLLHLADGTIIKAKVLVGCDGVNSVVAKFLGLEKPAFAGRSAFRGYADFDDAHEFEPRFVQYFGQGVKYGFLPCDDHTVYWFFTYTPSRNDREMEEDTHNMKQYVLDNLGEVPEKIKSVIETTKLDGIVSSPLRFRHPWELLWGNIHKDNVCVAGDALHPMTPDLGQGGCSALEDGIVLARCLGEAWKKKSNGKEGEGSEDNEGMRIKMGLKKYANERKWRGFSLISTAYLIGFLQQSDGKLISFVRDKLLGGLLAGLLMKRADFDCGNLSATA
ncbi:hypothetical protein DCAR_0103363 [Daucus carota subsp. sativus]|uniref:FAD-binding domain-containing protein n=1 Tax=Daucus carota subsp. sativus TaxID=79200 RepID=A0AAF1AKU8_DAUCS|nr:PREDICTED: FAD-dependent urate hydroxylase-like [Daucus carota subsp. sativus]WOG84182.1 hypothetical protein DCAR_0103363 [Daucus carota subsp. sativus]